jgi:uncharacterized membrane protein YphA (DoxX/SURF4 family)
MWICISLLTVQFGSAGLSKFLGDGWSSKFDEWGYPMALAYVVGALEIAAVVSLFFSRTRKWSSVVLMLIMLGAAYTHLSNSEPLRLIHNAVLGGIAFLVMHLDRKYLVETQTMQS